MPGTPDAGQERVVWPPPAGWYVDSSDAAEFRYWNGTAWEDRTSEYRNPTSEAEEKRPWQRYKRWTRSSRWWALGFFLFMAMSAGYNALRSSQDREEAIEELQNELGLTDAETDELVDSIDDLDGQGDADENDGALSDVELRTVRVIIPALVDSDPELDFEIDEWSDAQIRAITTEICQVAEADSRAEFMRWSVEVGGDDVVVATVGGWMACYDRLERLGF